MKRILIFALCLLTFCRVHAQSAENDSTRTHVIDSLMQAGIQYITGDIQSQSAAKAIALFAEAGAMGSADAYYLISRVYELDDLGMVDPAKATSYCIKAAEMGSNTALIHMAVRYEYGNGVEVDLDKSFRMMKEAADQGNQGASYMLAHYYFNGWGTATDRDAAKKCLSSITDKNYEEDAKKALKTIEQRDTMTTYELQFRWIPQILWDTKNDKCGAEELIDIHRWKHLLGTMFISHYEWNWDDMSCNVLHWKDYDIVVYTFSEPMRIPLCKYSAAFIDKKGKNYAYFTLEKTTFNGWMFCGMSPDNKAHLTYRIYKGKVTEEGFVKMAKKYIHKTQKYGASTVVPE